MAAERIDPTRLSTLDLRDCLASGAISASETAEAFLRRCQEVEPTVRAFAFLDPDHVRHQARRLDEHRKSGRPVGPLHGVPVALKDVIDTADMPTENGTPADAGRRPRQDAVLVTRLRQAGALIFGKTVTTELAYFAPGPTRNPHNPEHTPGGSSQGSAAAVAAGMVSLAVGTQTAGSVIRPAAFCGVVGYKPSFGLVPRTGVLSQARDLDTIGGFARDLAGVALLTEAMQGYEAGDPDTQPLPRLPLLAASGSEVPVRPLLAFVKGPTWDQATPDTVEAFAELAEALGENCNEFALPREFEEGLEAQLRLQHVGIARNYRRYAERHEALLSDVLKQAIEKGRSVTAVEYLAARDWAEVLGAGLERVFDRYDSIVTPAAPGEAPRDLSITGKPAFNALWTLLGVPAITLPLLVGQNGLPIGVQLIGRKGEDERLLRTASWLERTLMVTSAGDGTATGSPVVTAGEARTA